MLDALGRDYQWVHVDIMSGESRTPEFLLLNPFGQVPLLVFEDGLALAQSNAILLHLGEGAAWIPADDWERLRREPAEGPEWSRVNPKRPRVLHS